MSYLFEQFILLRHRSWEKLTDNSLYGIGVVRQKESCYWKLKNRQRRNLKELAHWSSFISEESFNRGDSDYIVSKDGLVALQWKDSKVMLLTNCMDLSMLADVEWRQERLKVPCPAIIKEYKSHINGVDIHNQLKTSYKFIANQGSVIISEFSLTSWIQLLSMSMSTQFQNHPHRIVDKPIFFSKMQRNCRGTSAHC